MSATVDRERAEDAERARNERAILVLEELLAIVKARRDERPLSQVAQAMGRSRTTLWSREALLRRILAMVGRNGARHAEGSEP